MVIPASAAPSRAAPSRAGSLPLVGTRLALDFANTSSGRGGPSHQEHLRIAGDIVAWARHAEVLPGADAARLARLVARRPDLAAALLARGLALRETIHAIAAAIAAGRPPARGRLAELSRTLADCVGRGVLAPQGDRFVWNWSVAAAPVEAVLGPVVLSAFALLRAGDLSRLKQCPGDHCGWLFYDSSRNRSRRWCEMEVCGNRAKQKRLQRRKVAERA